jgi:type III pantothenate kinase
MKLVIDIGNTRIKLAIFNNYLLIEEIAADHSQKADIIKFIGHGNKITHCIISAVTEIPEWLIKYLSDEELNPLLLDNSTPLPFKNSYRSKDTLGKDRIAAVAGAVHLYPGKNVLVIDAGTAITYEIKTAEEEYPGGNISPGLSMRYKALHNYTSKLPLLERNETTELMGRDTRGAILNGVQNGLIFEIEGYIERMSNKYPDLIVILTGGDAHFFANKLKKTIFVVSNLTLLGLNYILHYNAEIQ